MPIAGPAVPSMSLATMIEEKGLRKGFMVATLVSAVLSTFITSHNLYSQVKEKKKEAKQARLDTSQNDKIQEMTKRMEQLESGKGGGGGRDDPKYIEDAVSKAMLESQAVVARELEKGRAHLGDRFDHGDVYAENQLQKVIIDYQQSVINVLQNALNSGRQLDSQDRAQIARATDYARESTLDALRSQYQRLAPPSGRRMSLPPIYDDRRDQRRLTLPDITEKRRNDSAVSVSSHRSLGPPKRAATEASSSLYCHYSLDLQLSRRGLGAAFDTGRGDSRCPECDVRIPLTAGSSWEIIKPMTVLVTSGGGRTEKRVEERAFQIDSRFIVKCHTDAGMFACLLCNKKREFDALCKEPETLVSHIAKAHSELDFVDEPDIVELRN